VLEEFISSRESERSRYVHSKNIKDREKGRSLNSLERREKKSGNLRA